MQDEGFGAAFNRRLYEEEYLNRPHEPVVHTIVDEDGVEIEISEEQWQEWDKLLQRDASAEKLRKWLRTVRSAQKHLPEMRQDRPEH